MTSRRKPAAAAGPELLHAVADATPMPDARGHNALSFTAELLFAFVQRVELVEEDIKVRNGDKRDIYAEAKSMGLDVPTLKRCIADRRMDKAKFQEQQTLLALYRDRLAEAEAKAEAEE